MVSNVFFVITGKHLFDKGDFILTAPGRHPASADRTSYPANIPVSGNYLELSQWLAVPVRHPAPGAHWR
jgi:hypothetical protein